MKVTKLSSIHVLGVSVFGNKLILGLWWRQLEFDIRFRKTFIMLGVIKDPFGIAIGLGTKHFNFKRNKNAKQTSVHDE